MSVPQYHRVRCRKLTTTMSRCRYLPRLYLPVQKAASALTATTNHLLQNCLKWVMVLLHLALPVRAALVPQSEDLPIGDASFLEHYIELAGEDDGSPWDFVKTNGTQFTLSGEPWYPVGTNAFYAAQVDIMSGKDVYAMFKVSASRGLHIFYCSN